MPTLALDAMGGDHAPEATVRGAARYSCEPQGASVLLVGDSERIRSILSEVAHDAARLRIVDAPDVIGMDDVPQMVDERPRASLPIAAGLVATGAADVLVSAGNTGAVVLSCARHFQKLPAVTRCALGAVYPTERRRGEKHDPFSLILDAGLTLDVSADDLVGFAVMGAAYASRISKNPTPKVALLSNGSEAHKGTASVVAAHPRLAAMASIDFIGNIEGMDIPRGTADVVVTGGFVGNIVLKMLEGVSETVTRLGRYAYKKNLAYKAGLALLAPAVKELRQVTDWEQYGGAPVLGFDHICIKAHGRSTERAVYNALKVANRCVTTELVRAISDGLEKSRSASSAPSSAH